MEERKDLGQYIAVEGDQGITPVQEAPIPASAPPTNYPEVQWIPRIAEEISEGVGSGSSAGGHRPASQEKGAKGYMEGRAMPGPIEGKPSEASLQLSWNSRVELFTRHYTTRGRRHFSVWLENLHRYLPMMRAIFRQMGLPTDLVYLVIVESGANPRARSRRGAIGLWQFMKGTARKYGLRVDWWVDERMDPVKATRAAASYLRDLYKAFGKWELAIAAYNAGEGRISWAIRRRGTTDFWRLCRYRDLKRETRDFVPKFIAAMKIAKDPLSFGLEGVDSVRPWRYDEVCIKGLMDLGTIARLSDTTVREIRELNPHLKRWYIPPSAKCLSLRVPEGKGEVMTAALDDGRLKGRQARVVLHRVRRGDTLWKLARLYGVPVNVLKDVNRITSVRGLRVGSRLIIPKPTPPRRMAYLSRIKKSASGERYPSGGDKEVIFHKVKRGETLWSISRKYGVRVSDISRWNGLEGNKIMPGETLKVIATSS